MTVQIQINLLACVTFKVQTIGVLLVDNVRPQLNIPRAAVFRSVLYQRPQVFKFRNDIGLRLRTAAGIGPGCQARCREHNQHHGQGKQPSKNPFRFHFSVFAHKLSSLKSLCHTVYQPSPPWYNPGGGSHAFALFFCLSDSI